MGAHLKAFKLEVRRIARRNLTDESQAFFKVGQKKGYPLRRLGVANHFGTISLNVRISKEAQKHLDKEVLRAKGGKQKDLEKQAAGEQEVEYKELLLKHKVLWSRTIKKLPPQQVKELGEEKLQKVACFNTQRVRKVLSSLRPRARSAKNLRLPEHDKVKLMYSNGKRNCTQALLKEQPPQKLRLGMLSAKLQAKFRHLCTETGWMGLAFFFKAVLLPCVGLCLS